MYNSGPIMRTLIKACRLFLTKKMQERIVLANNDEALLERVPITSLPVTGGGGNVTDEEAKQLLLKQFAKYEAFDKVFKL